MSFIKQNIAALSIFLLALGIRLAFWPLSDIIDSDAVSRVFIAEIWLTNPTLVWSGVWPSMHTYLNAAFIALFNNRVWPPVLLHILLGSLLTLPIFGIAKRLFNSSTAIVAGLLVALNPLLIRNSLLPMAEIPHALFVMCSMYFILKGLDHQNKNQINIVLAGLCITVATGLRYEAWLTLLLFGLIILAHKKIKSAFVFGLFGLIFPIGWMWGNYIDYGNPFYGADYATWYNVDFMGVNNQLSRSLWLQRVLFFPLSVIHFLPFGLSIIIVVVYLFKLVTRKIEFVKAVWLFPFFIFLGIMVLKATQGTLLLQQRFSLGLLVFAIPYVGVLFGSFKLKNKHLGLSLLLIATFIPVSFWLRDKPILEKLIPQGELKNAIAEIRYFNFDQLMAIPQLKKPERIRVLQKIESTLTQGTPLIIDFIDWESSYYISYHSGVRAELITTLPAEHLNAEPGFAEVEWMIQYPNWAEKGVAVLIKNSPHYHHAKQANGKYAMELNKSLVPLLLKDSLETAMIFTFDTKLVKQAYSESQ